MLYSTIPLTHKGITERNEVEDTNPGQLNEVTILGEILEKIFLEPHHITPTDKTTFLHKQSQNTSDP